VERRQQEIVLPGDMQPYTERTDLRAHHWLPEELECDIGARVKAAKLLAEIDTPEGTTVQQARSDLETAGGQSALGRDHGHPL